MAKMLRRHYIGIEISAEYVNGIILPRLAATPVPLPLDIPAQQPERERQVEMFGESA